MRLAKDVYYAEKDPNRSQLSKDMVESLKGLEFELVHLQKLVPRLEAFADKIVPPVDKDLRLFIGMLK